MHIGAQAIRQVALVWPSDHDLGWFAVRQPGVLRFLEDRLGSGSEAFAVSLAGAWRILEAYRQHDGLPSPLLPHGLLRRAAYAVSRETAAHVCYEGLAVRQPEMCEYSLSLVADPPYPLTAAECHGVGDALLAVTYAVDEVAFGRPIS